MRRKNYFVIKSLSMWTAFQLQSLTPLDVKHAPLFLSRVGGSTEDHNTVIHFYDLYNRAAFVTLVNFQVEFFLKCLNSHFKLKSNNGFWNISDTLLSNITIKNKVRKQRILNILAKIRNALHTSGKHTEHPFSITLNGCRFNFKTNSTIRHADWNRILFSTHGIIDVIEEILDSPEVSKIKYLKKI